MIFYGVLPAGFLTESVKLMSLKLVITTKTIGVGKWGQGGQKLSIFGVKFYIHFPYRVLGMKSVQLQPF